MRILLDECVPWPMHRLLAGPDCTTAPKCGWGGIKNGDLLRLPEGQFDLFITSDQNIQYQQNMADRSIPILEISTHDLRRIHTTAAEIVAAVAVIQPGQVSPSRHSMRGGLHCMDDEGCGQSIDCALNP